MLESFVGELKYKKLSPEEMKSRRILGRLVGPMADTIHGTRNERSYSRELWEKALGSDLFKEKLANKCILSELGHPSDRSEILISEACAALAEQPKLGKDGKLYGVWDILDTPNGQILKTLCDYGTKIGISSRGEGDLIEGINGEEVDPDTYSLETWDMVLLPAVKEARMNYVTESLNKKHCHQTLKERLAEQLDQAEGKNREIMAETLNNLDIKLDEEAVSPEGYTAALRALHDAIEDDTDTKGLQKFLCDMIKQCQEIASDYDIELNCDQELDEALHVQATPEIELIYKDKALKDLIEKDEDTHDALLDACADALQDLGSEKMSFHITYDDDIADWYIMECKMDESIKECDTVKECADKTNEAVTEEKQTEDVGVDPMVEQLQATLKENALLKKQMQELQDKLAVSGTEASKMNEELTHYKSATISLSAKAKEAKRLEKKVSTLNETVEKQAKDLRAKAAQKLQEGTKASKQLTMLTESVKQQKAEIQQLNEKLADAQANAELKRSEYNKTITKAKTLIKEYKALAQDTVNRYIESKAVILGVSANEIKNRLTENYSIDEIDKVCDSLQSYQVNISKLPFNISKKNVRVTESKKEALQVMSPFDDDIDEDLLALAKMHF